MQDSKIPAKDALLHLKETGIPYSDCIDIISFITGTPYSLTVSKLEEQALPRGRLLSALEDISKKIPAAYITGRKEFYGYEFDVSPCTLIPRPETEVMINVIKEDARQPFTYFSSTPHIIDLCTGAGIILISLLKIFPCSMGTGVDISNETTALAAKNASKLGVNNRAKFIQEDILLWNDTKWLEIGQGFDIITANPPYLSELEYESSDISLKYEPKSSLVAGNEGYQFYTHILEKAALSKRALIYFEVGAGGAERVGGIAKGLGFNVVFYKDMAEILRVARCIKGENV